MAALSYDEDVIVIDSGSDLTRIGMSGQGSPGLVEKTVIGKPKRRASIAVDEKDSKHLYAGEEAIARQSILNIVHPVQKGIVTDWPSLEALWRMYFEKLSYDIEGTNYPLLVTQYFPVFFHVFVSTQLILFSFSTRRFLLTTTARR